MRRFLGLMVVAGCALVLSTQVGCAKRGKGGVKVDKEAVKEFILDDVPADAKVHKTDVNFEDKVHLIAWSAEPEMAAPGSTVRFTLYWKKTGDLDPGWKLFTHVTTDDVKQAKGNLSARAYDWRGGDPEVRRSNWACSRKWPWSTWIVPSRRGLALLGTEEVRRGDAVV